MITLQISPKRESFGGLGRQATGILQLLQGSYFDNYKLKTLKLDWLAFHSVTFQCLDFQSNQYGKLVPVLSRFCKGLLISLQSYFFQIYSGYGPGYEPPISKSG